MPLVTKPVAFGSVGFTPGFPSLSQFKCDPFTTAGDGRCATPPTVLGRTAMPFNGADVIAATIAADRGIMPTQLAGLGCAGKSDCGCGCSGGGIGHSLGHSLGDESAMLLGGSSGTGGFPATRFVPYSRGMGATFDVNGLLAWAKENAVPLLVGGAAVYFLKKR